MIITATIFAAFCLLSAAFQYIFFALLRKPSAEAPVQEEQEQPLRMTEEFLPYLLVPALEVEQSSAWRN
jgi:hypothetical protein